MTNNNIHSQLLNKVKKGTKLVGVSVGSGISAVNASKNNADLILFLSSGIFRNRGVSSLGAYLAASNSNDLNLSIFDRDIATKKIDTPIIFGLMATDPTINIENFISCLKDRGIFGINNYPTVGLIDGQFRNYLEEHNLGYDQEVRAIKIAKQKGMFTTAFVFNEIQIKQMLDAGADIICLHLGLSVGGDLGTKQIKSLQYTNHLIQQIFHSFNEDILQEKMIMLYGGPIKSQQDFQYLCDQNEFINGYIGGSLFERIPTEEGLKVAIDNFKYSSDEHMISFMNKKDKSPEEYINFVQAYIHQHYYEYIFLNELADILYISRPYLSKLFKQVIGKSFKEYLVMYRLARAEYMLLNTNQSVKEIADSVGYNDYAHFSKLFKQKYGLSPTHYKTTN